MNDDKNGPVSKFLLELLELCEDTVKDIRQSEKELRQMTFFLGVAVGLIIGGFIGGWYVMRSFLG